MNSKLEQLKYELKEAVDAENKFRELEKKNEDLKWKQWSRQLEIKKQIKELKINELKGREVNEDFIKELDKIEREEW